jgi:hypothetical protein
MDRQARLGHFAFFSANLHVVPPSRSKKTPVKPWACQGKELLLCITSRIMSAALTVSVPGCIISLYLFARQVAQNLSYSKYPEMSGYEP